MVLGLHLLPRWHGILIPLVVTDARCHSFISLMLVKFKSCLVILREERKKMQGIAVEGFEAH
jgi:hypothetical protein